MSFLPEKRRRQFEGSVEEIRLAAVIAGCTEIQQTLMNHGIIVETKPIDQSSTRDDIEVTLSILEAGILRLDLVGGPQVGRDVKKSKKRIKGLRELGKSADRLEKVADEF